MNLIFLILSTSVFMSLIILLVLAMFTLWPQALSGKTRYIIWIVILIGLIIPFRPIFGNGLFQIETPASVTSALPVQEETITSPKTAVSPNDTSVQNELPVNASSVTTADADAAPAKPAEKKGFSFSIVSLILVIWGIGAAVSFSRHLFKYFQFRKMVQRWSEPITDLATLELLDIVKENMGLQRKSIDLIRCSTITTPMLTGFVKPTILLPDKPLEDDELELIFEHELTHYKHKDLYVNLLGTLAVSLHWFNPIVYFCYPSIQGDGEVCCDEAVLSNRDLDYRRFYGEVIISMIERNNTKHVAFSTCFYAKKLNIKRRLFAIMETNNRRKKISIMAVGLILALIIVSGSIVAFGAPSNKKYIGVDRAKTIALNDAGLSQNEVTFIKAKLDTDDGVKVYDIEFYSGNTEYDYEIDARNGKIREFDHDINNFVIPGQNNGNNTGTTQISLDKAKKIALADAKLKAKQVTFVKAALDTDDGVQVYDIEFYSGNTEYDYEIDAKTGVIREKDFDVENFTVPAPSTNNNTALIGVEKAKSIALADAKLNANQVAFVKAKLDKDDGVQVYDIEFYSGNTEYDYEIDAKTGAIREKDFDVENFTVPAPSTNNNNTLIGVEKAKAIALADAKLNANQVAFVKAKLDNDDGVQVYDIEFYSGNTEYDYEIDAKTGAIREKDFDVENFNVPAPAPAPAPTPNTNTNSGITLERAKAIALSHAGLTAGQVVFEKAKLDTDDGIQVFEIDFRSGNVEYDYEIDAKSGRIRDFSKEIDD